MKYLKSYRVQFMVFTISWILLFLSSMVLWTVDASEPQFAPFQRDDDTPRTHINLQGWNVQIVDLTYYDPHTVIEFLNVLERQLKHVNSVLPAEVIPKLQGSTPIWVSDRFCGGSAATFWYTSNDPTTGYIEFKCIEKGLKQMGQSKSRTRNSKNQNAVYHLALHEIAHAWQHKFVPDGFENECVKYLFARAKSTFIDDHTAYWETDEIEFFAEFSIMLYAKHYVAPYALTNTLSSDDGTTQFAWSLERIWTGFQDDRYPAWTEDSPCDVTVENER